MPVQLKTTTAPTVAQTPEFQALQKQIEQATSLLASISNQIVAIEARMKPTPQPGTNPQPTQPTQPTQPDEQNQQEQEPARQQPQGSFEESIAEMRKIAGIK
jgi:RecB family exonuclease